MTKRQRYIYNGYVQIAEIDATNEDAPQVVKTYLWDPSEPVATRILHMTVWNNGVEVESLYYTHDLQKNVTALFGQAAGRRAQYEHDPYGNPINTTGDAAGQNPYRYSSEYHDEDLGLIYYNYRHYNPTDGRWINRDPIAEQGGINLYGFIRNRVSSFMDVLGLSDSVTVTIGQNPQGGTALGEALGWSRAGAQTIAYLALQQAQEAAEKAEEEARRRKRCDNVYRIYKMIEKSGPLSCKGFPMYGVPCSVCIELYRRLRRFYRVLKYRRKYMELDCDEYMDGSKKRGIADAKRGHSEEIDTLNNGASLCANKLDRNGCNKRCPELKGIPFYDEPDDIRNEKI